MSDPSRDTRTVRVGMMPTAQPVQQTAPAAVASPPASPPSTTSSSYPCIRNLVAGSILGGVGGFSVGALQRRPALPFGLMGASFMATSCLMRCGLSMGYDRGLVDVEPRYFDGLCLLVAGATVPLNPYVRAAVLNQPVTAAHKIVLKQTSLFGILLGGAALVAGHYANDDARKASGKGQSA